MSARQERSTPARVSKKPAAGSTSVAGGGPAATRRPSSPEQLPAGPQAGREAPQPSVSSFVRTSPPAKGAAPSAASLLRIPSSTGTRGSKPAADVSPVSAKSLLPVSSNPSGSRRRAPSVAPASTAPTSTLPPVRPPRLALTSGSTPVEVNSFTCQSLVDFEPQGLGVTLVHCHNIRHGELA